jgi:hypothetical protein
MLITWMLVLATMAVMMPRLISHYLGRLPYAPECPDCHAVTGQATRHGAADRICALLAATPVRTCARCGWAGRMRWRPAYERIRQH